MSVSAVMKIFMGMLPGDELRCILLSE